MKKTSEKDSRPFALRHPRWNLFFGIVLLLTMAAIGVLIAYYIFFYIGVGTNTLIDWLRSFTSKTDAVVIVALITGAVSIIGVVISSVVSKRLEYKKSRQEYLAQKREKPYGEFVDMVYKIQQNNKSPESYTQQEMIEDIASFSKGLTLWGSKKVANKWVEFRTNGANPAASKENLFVLEGILNEMRKDLGVKKLKKGNLLAFFVNDIKTAMKTAKK